MEAQKRSDSSVALESTLHQWLAEQSDIKRRTFVNTLFGLLESTGRATIGEIKGDLLGSLSSMWKMLESMPKEQREITWNMITQFIAAGSDTILQEIRKTLVSRIESIQLPKVGTEPQSEEDA